MGDSYDFVPAVDGDVTALGDVLAHAFGFPREDSLQWFDRAGGEQLRVLKRGQLVCGGLIEIPMGQFFGGRSVSTMGVAGVGIRPTERGRGAGTQLMLSMLREAKARGFALSTLYPATITLYRSAGYERAGTSYTLELDPRTCHVDKVPEMTVTEVEGATEGIVALYTRCATRSSGFLDRGPYCWSRVTNPRNLAPKMFAVSHGGNLEGYVAAAHVSSGRSPTTIKVTDLAATTSRAARAIVRFLVEYRSLAGAVTWSGGPSDIFGSVLPERHAELRVTEYFMIRIVDVVRAFAMRGWPKAAAGTITFELDDATMPETSGRYTVTLREGEATIDVGESASRAPVVHLTERALAALYSGHLGPRLLEDLGWLEADAALELLLTSWFAGPAPTMRDFF
jgi:predicted acetyltransferase